MAKDEIVRLVHEAVEDAQRGGDLPPLDLPAIPLSHPRAEHGDYATPLPLQLARQARMAPLQIAETIVRHLPPAEFLAAAEVARPGFINFTLSDGWLARQVEAILAAGERYGHVDVGRGKRVQVEYVSANPTGPLTMGSGRNAVLGDTLANLLSAAGYAVQREYYINDAGTQMRLFHETLYARYAQALGQDEPIPEAGYRGQYMTDMGERAAREFGLRFLEVDREEAIAALGQIGLGWILAQIREDLEALSIRHDRWFSERSLYESGLFDRVLALLRERGVVAEREGAVWFTASELGEDKDNVIIRSDGEPGYFASDIAYHFDKFVERGFDRVIDVWGADHQGHVPRMKAMMRALGLDPERLTLILYQLVTLKRGGEVVRLSKRTGEIITLREVVDEVGADAVRFFLLQRSADAQMDFDLELAKAESDENPVYYVQYAHARLASILRYAAEQGVEPAGGDVSRLTHPAELALIRQMLLLPECVELAATALAPHHLPHYAQDVASAFHSFYKQCRVISSDPADADVNRARLKLALAARLVLARTLALMGVSAPEKM
jgi:arginyl-tRNA synthetase